MSDIRSLVEDSVVKLFADQVDRDFMIDSEDEAWAGGLWDTLSELGIDRVLVSEANDGMGGRWQDAYPVVRAAGQFSVPLPVAEAIIARWLLETAGVGQLDGVPGLLPEPLAAGAGGTQLSAVIPRIPWGRRADYFLGLTTAAGKSELLVVDSAGVRLDEDYSLAREPRDTATFDGVSIAERAPIDLPADAIRWLLALARSAQIAGAGSACLRLGLEYTSEREQFGRPLARFQAIQHHLAHMAGELGTVEAMSASGFEAMSRYGLSRVSDRDAKFEIAAAKCRASDAVEPLSKIGHQVHGAIGFTHEYGLHFLTRRLWSWRAEFGGGGEWAEYLGKVAVDTGGDDIWGLITN